MEVGDRVKKIAINPKTGSPEEIIGNIVYKGETDSIVEIDEGNDILKRFYGAGCRRIRISDEYLRPVK